MCRQLKWKSLQDYIKEDPSLTQKITANEFIEGSAVLQESDISVESALNVYRELIVSKDERMKMEPRQ